jgi:signal peptidase II
VNALLFWPVMLAVVVVDQISKAVAEAVLSPARIPREVIGDVVRFTLVYNPGAAFGLYLGSYSRWIFMSLSIAALGILFSMYRRTSPGDWWRTFALSLVAAGALGNLIDRFRSVYGVVDFIDVGLGAMRWPTFNVADVAVSGGAFLLAWVLWEEEGREGDAAAVTADVEPSAPSAR